MKTLTFLAIFLVSIIATNCSHTNKEYAMNSLESNQIKLKAFQNEIDSMNEIQYACIRKIRVITGDTIRSMAIKSLAFRKKKNEKKETKQADLNPAQKDSLKLLIKQLNDAGRKIAVCNDSIKQIKIRIDELKTAYNTSK